MLLAWNIKQIRHLWTSHGPIRKRSLLTIDLTFTTLPRHLTSLKKKIFKCGIGCLPSAEQVRTDDPQVPVQVPLQTHVAVEQQNIGRCIQKYTKTASRFVDIMVNFSWEHQQIDTDLNIFESIQGLVNVQIEHHSTIGDMLSPDIWRLPKSLVSGIFTKPCYIFLYVRFMAITWSMVFLGASGAMPSHCWVSPKNSMAGLLKAVSE
jgi:hypothetical protein